MIGLIIECVIGFAFESARCKQLKEAYVGPVVDMVRFQGWASTHRLNSQFGLSQRDARFVLLVACQRGLIFQAVNGRFYLKAELPEVAPSADSLSPQARPVKLRPRYGAGLAIGALALSTYAIGAYALNVAGRPSAASPMAVGPSTAAFSRQPSDELSRRLNAEPISEPARHADARAFVTRLPHAKVHPQPSRAR